MKKVFVDTNILIDYSKGFDKTLEKLLLLQNENKLQIFINPVVVAEFFNDKNLNTPKKLEKAQRFFSFFNIKEITKETGFIAGELLRTKQVDFFADALIASTCIENGFEFLTKNKKDFKKVNQLRFFTGT